MYLKRYHRRARTAAPGSPGVRGDARPGDHRPPCQLPGGHPAAADGRGFVVVSTLRLGTCRGPRSQGLWPLPCEGAVGSPEEVRESVMSQVTGCRTDRC
jgi:hypothetical protein